MEMCDEAQSYVDAMWNKAETIFSNLIIVTSGELSEEILTSYRNFVGSFHGVRCSALQLKMKEVGAKPIVTQTVEVMNRTYEDVRKIVDLYKKSKQLEGTPNNTNDKVDGVETTKETATSTKATGAGVEATSSSSKPKNQTQKRQVQRKDANDSTSVAPPSKTTNKNKTTTTSTTSTTSTTTTPTSSTATPIHSVIWPTSVVSGSSGDLVDNSDISSLNSPGSQQLSSNTNDNHTNSQRHAAGDAGTNDTTIIDAEPCEPAKKATRGRKRKTAETKTSNEPTTDTETLTDSECRSDCRSESRGSKRARSVPSKTSKAGRLITIKRYIQLFDVIAIFTVQAFRETLGTIAALNFIAEQKNVEPFINDLRLPEPVDNDNNDDADVNVPTPAEIRECVQLMIAHFFTKFTELQELTELGDTSTKWSSIIKLFLDKFGDIVSSVISNLFIKNQLTDEQNKAMSAHLAQYKTTTTEIVNTVAKLKRNITLKTLFSDYFLTPLNTLVFNTLNTHMLEVKRKNQHFVTLTNGIEKFFDNTDACGLLFIIVAKDLKEEVDKFKASPKSRKNHKLTFDPHKDQIEERTVFIDSDSDNTEDK